jgi:hypothetical protein
MTAPTRNNNSATQAAEATQNIILDLLNNLKNPSLISEALGEICRQL